MNGGTVTGFSSSGESSIGIREIKESLYNAKNAGNTRALIVLDGAYQFSVSIGVFAEK